MNKKQLTLNIILITVPFLAAIYVLIRSIIKGPADKYFADFIIFGLAMLLLGGCSLCKLLDKNKKIFKMNIVLIIWFFFTVGATGFTFGEFAAAIKNQGFKEAQFYLYEGIFWLTLFIYFGYLEFFAKPKSIIPEDELLGPDEEPVSMEEAMKIPDMVREEEANKKNE